MTRPRACRMCTSMCAAYSACSRRMSASCRPSWAAGSVRDCARSSRWCWRFSRRALQRSVRVVLTRPQMYGLGYRPAMIQHVAVASNAAGTLEAITHDAITVTSQYEDFHRQETGWSGLLYKCDHAKYQHRLARLDLATSCDMRGPSAASGVYALECAMDELAVALRLDPLELRLRCYSDRDQNADRPYSSKSL